MASHDESDVTPGRKAHTRRAILAAAGELFADRGIDGTGVDEVAELAHVSIGTLYHHFGSKEGLALAFAESALEVIERHMAMAWEFESPIDRVVGAGDAYLRFAIEFPAACRFATARGLQPADGSGFSKAGKRLRDRVRKILVRVATDLQEAMDAGLIRREPIGSLMIFLWAAWNGVAIMVVRQDALQIPPEAAEESLALGKRLVLAALAP